MRIIKFTSLENKEKFFFNVLRKEVKKLYTFNNIIIFIGCLLFLSFRHYFYQYFPENFLFRFASNIGQDLCTSVFIFTGWVCICVLLFNWVKYKSFEIGNFVLSIIIGIFYLTIRFESGWYFYGFSYFQSVYYSDGIFVGCSIIINCQLFNFPYSIKKGVKNEKTYLGFLESNPLRENEEEHLGYDKYAENLAEKINLTQSSGSFAIAINGEWGVGKTSFFNKLKPKLNADFIPLHFDPWKSVNADGIILDFFDEMNNALFPFGGKKIIIKYAKKLISADHIQFKVLGYVLDLFQADKSSSDLFCEVKSLIEKKNKKIVVFVDDVDRLDNSEIIELLRLIRDTANFPNLFFVVAFDRNYVVNAIKDFNDYKSERYLEKIFQVEINLPYFKKHALSDLLFDLVKKRINDSENDLFNKFNEIKDRSFFIKYLETARDVNKLVNSFILHKAIIQDFLNLEDFLKIELVKLKYPDVYKDLKENREKFLFESKDYLLNRYNSNVKNGKEELTDVNILLEKIFPKIENVNISLNSVRYQAFYYSYYSFSKLNSISESEFTTILKSDLKNIRKAINLILENDLYPNLEFRISNYKYETFDQFKNLLKFTICFFGQWFENNPDRDQIFMFKKIRDMIDFESLKHVDNNFRDFFINYFPFEDCNSLFKSNFIKQEEDFLYIKGFSKKNIDYMLFDILRNYINNSEIIIHDDKLKSMLNNSILKYENFKFKDSTFEILILQEDVLNLLQLKIKQNPEIFFLSLINESTNRNKYEYILNPMFFSYFRGFREGILFFEEFQDRQDCGIIVKYLENMKNLSIHKAMNLGYNFNGMRERYYSKMHKII